MEKIFVILILLVSMVLSGCYKDNDELEEQDIKITYTRNSNYVYHMLAVAGCGYDSDYGNNYKESYDSKDLKILKENEYLISVSGGEHEGILYEVLIGKAAAVPDEESIVSYYEDIITNLDKTDKNAEAMKQIAEVMSHNYSVYCEKIWPQVQPKLQAYTEELQKYFIDKKHLKRWEEELGYKYHSNFEALICEALEGGPEAILITDSKDIFAQKDSENIENRVSFISHEAGMALVKQNGFFGMQSVEELLEKYHTLESTVEYYNRKIVGYELAGTWNYELVNQIEELDETEHFENAEKLFTAAWQNGIRK